MPMDSDDQRMIDARFASLEDVIRDEIRLGVKAIVRAIVSSSARPEADNDAAVKAHEEIIMIGVYGPDPAAGDAETQG